jgi:hypothetical protein
MEPADPEVAAYIAQWRPSSLSLQAAAFARDVIGQVAPEGKERAKNLLWAAGKLADYAIPLGLEPVPEVMLHPSTAERFTRRAPGLSGVARRTLRTNLRFIGRQVVPQLYPADMPLPRERAKAPAARRNRRVSRLGGRPAHPAAADAGRRADLPGRRRRADPRRPARRARHRRDLPVRRGDRGRLCATERGSACYGEGHSTRDHSAASMGSERIRTRPRAIVTSAPVPSSSATAGRFATSKAACCSGVRRSADLSRTTDGRTAPREMASSSPKSVSAEIITNPFAAA